MEHSFLKRKEVMRIAIVGGGASAVLILEALNKRISRMRIKPSITIFEKNSSLGRGLAYRSNIKNLILNTSVDTMSVCESTPDDFRCWLQDNTTSETSITEIPRGLYGTYLEFKMEKCLRSLAEMGCDIRIYYAAVDKINLGDKYTLSFSEKEESYDVCIVATGGDVTVPDNFDEEVSAKVLDIFDESKISAIKKNSKVAIMGSGQSAVDACLMLEQLNSQCHYTLVSRNGVLPRVKSNLSENKDINHVSTINIINPHLPRLCHEIIGSIKWKMSGEGALNFSPASFRSMEVDLKRALKTLPSWQRTMTALTPFINELWSRHSEEEKHAFSQNWHRSMYFLRSAIMPESASRFLDVYHSGRLGMIWGDYHLSANNNGFRLLAKNSSLSFDYVINTTGIKAISHLKLLRDEIENKKIAVNPQGGLSVDFDSMKVLDGFGKPHEGLFSVGYPTQGSVLISNSVELLRQKAVKIARNITEKIYQGIL
ncbi:FAD/NAD(P)-binding protein [Erwinia rhapontici]|uniref:FAD/NAD(P)-binding protein n=1 Tax=Erwinia rhapontici TaxID=55212 RepID=UPI003BA31A1A